MQRELAGQGRPQRAAQGRPTTTRSARSSAPRPREKQAAKARQTERLIERLEVVEEPRKEWELRMEIAAAPRVGRGRGHRCAARSSAAGDVHASDRSTCRSTGPTGSRSPAPTARASRPCWARCSAGSPLDEGTRGAGPGRAGRRDRPGARAVRRAASRCSRAFGDAGAGLAGRRGPHPAGQVRAAAPSTCPRPARSLSPGERTRAALALLQARGVNLLVLDEPTNHLDLPAIEQLEQALASYPGTLLLVTHDRRMLEAVHTTRLLDVADGQVHER